MGVLEKLKSGEGAFTQDIINEIERLRECLKLSEVMANMPMSQVEAELRAELERVKKERDALNTAYSKSLEARIPEALELATVIKQRDELVALIQQIRADIDAHDVLPEWLPIIDDALAKAGADKTGEVG